MSHATVLDWHPIFFIYPYPANIFPLKMSFAAYALQTRFNDGSIHYEPWSHFVGPYDDLGPNCLQMLSDRALKANTEWVLSTVIRVKGYFIG